VWPELPKGATGKIMKLEIKKKVDEGAAEAKPAQQQPAQA
jgi:acyl-coenzyme A synthetase/AMP-(fatty) acid ligase